MVFGNLLGIAVHSYCKLPMLGDIYYFPTSSCFNSFRLFCFWFSLFDCFSSRLNKKKKIEEHKGSAIGNHLREQHDMEPEDITQSFRILRNTSY